MSLLGGFNDWSTTSHPMTPIGDGGWELDVQLCAGPHRFAYFILTTKHQESDGGGTGTLSSLVLEENSTVVARPTRMAC